MTCRLQTIMDSMDITCADQNQKPVDSTCKIVLEETSKLESKDKPQDQVDLSVSVSKADEPTTSRCTPKTDDIESSDNLAHGEGVVESEENNSTSYYWNHGELVLMKCNDSYSNSLPQKYIASTSKEFGPENILKGCKWAPDGSCLLTSSDDSVLRLFNLPPTLCNTGEWTQKSESIEDLSESPLEPVLKVKEGGAVYDYCWYPLMSSLDPATCCFITAAGDNPIHLFDAFDGKLRASYLPFNHLEQIVAPHAVEFDPTGNYIYSGYKNSIKIFNIQRPGKEFVERKLKSSILPDLNLSGIISCFAFNPNYGQTIFACGSFQKNIGIYLEDGTVMAILSGHLGGVTHLKFSHDGTKLISGSRKDSRLIIWDIRNLGDEYQILNREVETNQRIYFDITKSDRYLVSGQTNGLISIWDLHSGLESSNPESKNEDLKQTQFKGSSSSDCITGISINPFVPILATTSGQRHFCEIANDSDDELFVNSTQLEEHSLKLWKLL